MNATHPQPVPMNLRAQMLQRIAAMSDQDVAELHELVLLNEKLRLRREISAQAEREQAEGRWDDLQEFVRAYRSRTKPA